MCSCTHSQPQSKLPTAVFHPNCPTQLGFFARASAVVISFHAERCAGWSHCCRTKRTKCAARERQPNRSPQTKTDQRMRRICRVRCGNQNRPPTALRCPPNWANTKDAFIAELLWPAMKRPVVRSTAMSAFVFNGHTVHITVVPGRRVHFVRKLANSRVEHSCVGFRFGCECVHQCGK